MAKIDAELSLCTLVNAQKHDSLACGMMQKEFSNYEGRFY